MGRGAPRVRPRRGSGAGGVRAGSHPTTLQRAASGERVPKLQTVLNYARACDASPEEARLLWTRARYEETRLARGGRGRPAPRPEFIRDFVDLGAALVELYDKAGSPPLRTMEQRAGGFGALPRSSAHRIRNKQAMPHSLRQFQAYLRACEVPETEWPDWEAAWTRAWRHEKHDDFAALGTSGVPDVDILDAIGLSPKDILTATRASKGLRERLQQHYRIVSEADGEVIIGRDGTFRRVPVQAKHREVRGRVRPPRMGRVLGKSSEAPVQEQLDFAVPYSEPAPAPGALF